jgi:head-tail adaptor
MAARTASELKQRIIVSRLTKTADGYGGWTSTTAVIGTYWCQILETSGDISAKNGIRSLETKIDIAIRRPTADLIQNQDILQVEGNASTYRINSGYQTIENFWVKITATKIEG